MQKRGILAVVSGFSGAGKGTLMRELVSRYSCYALSVSATTRSPRAGEAEGVSYFFKTREEFEEMIRQEAFIEYAAYVGHYYGTPKEYVLSRLEEGRDVILEIEIQGALRVKEQYPDAVLLFVMTPGAAELLRRLRLRGTEGEDVIRSRLERACEEARGIEAYDYVVVNDVLEDCVQDIHHIIQGECWRVARNLGRIEAVRQDLCKFLET